MIPIQLPEFLRQAAESAAESAVAVALREGAYTFPVFEMIHVLGIAILFGSLLVVDLRLIGLGMRTQRISDVMESGIRFTWIGFAIIVPSGLVMLASNAVRYLENAAFQWKMVFLVLAGINMLVFELVVARDHRTWPEGHHPVAARICGGLSLVFWVCIIWFGRWIGFTMSPF